MKRFLILLALIGTTMSVVQLPALAEREVVQAPVQTENVAEWRFDECRFESLREESWTVYEIKLTMQCAIAKWSVPGGFDKALDVAQCESGSDLKEVPEDGDPVFGTYQQQKKYWNSRRNTYNPKAWEHPLPKGGNNPRANVVVSIRMAHAKGWNSDWPGCS